MTRRVTTILASCSLAAVLLATGCGPHWSRHAHVYDRGYDRGYVNTKAKGVYVDEGGDLEVSAVYATRTIPVYDHKPRRHRGGSFFSFGFGYSTGYGYGHKPYSRSRGYHSSGHYGYRSRGYGYHRPSYGYGSWGSRVYGCRPY